MRKIEPDGKTPARVVVELARRLEVVAERLLHDHAAPLVGALRSARPCSLSWPTTVPKKPGGIAR